MIPVVKPFLPNKERYTKLIDGIWERNWLTNNGPLVCQLENDLSNYLGVSNLKYLGNGTIALQIAIKALELSGDIITTPFSYVATTSCIVWEGCKPVFCDIDQHSLNIDPDKIESCITERTSAILATHVYGNACDIDAIELTAKKHNLKVIYDAAHCFGTTYKGKSILEYGDISTISFHATKLFHTIEGGAIVTNSTELDNKVNLLRNFGHNGPYAFSGVGINGKNSEMHAAMGIVNLDYVDNILLKRKQDYLKYLGMLGSMDLEFITVNNNCQFNYSYFPVKFESQEDCENVLSHLAEFEIYARRYFYPVLSNLDYVTKGSVPVSEDISKRVLCLPLFYQIEDSEIELVCKHVKLALLS